MVVPTDVYLEQVKIQVRTKGRYPTDKHEDHKDRCLQLAAEVFEVLELAEWKPHRHDRTKPIDREKLKDELVDVYKFWLNLLIIHGIGPQEFEDAYNKKHGIVLDRLRQEGL